MPFKFSPFSGTLDYYESGSGGTGDVVGPASATDNAIVRFDSTTGKLVQNSGVVIDDTNHVIAPNNAFYKAKNAAGTVEASLIGIDSSDNLMLGHSTGFNIRVRTANFIPDVDNATNLGSGANAWANLYVNNVQTALTWPSNNAQLKTAAAAATNGFLIGSGDASGGNSGDITLQIGSATGTRGKIIKADGSEGTANHVWRSINTTGSGGWVNPNTIVDHGSIGGLADDDHTQYIRVDGTRNFTGSQNTLALLPVTNGGSNLGSTSFRYDEIHARRLRILHPGSTTFSGTLNSNSNYFLNSSGSTTGSITANIGAASAPAIALANILTEGGTNTITVTGNQSLFIGGFADVGGGVSTNTITINQLGAIALGVCYNSFGATGSSATLQSFATGSTVIGAAFHNNFAGAGSARLTAGTTGGSAGRGAFVQGAAFPSSFALAYAAVIEATADGSMARGFAGRGLIRATGAGAACSAYMLAGNDTAYFLASGLGSAIFGANNGGTGSATASGNGATINCYLTGANNVTASGEASGCWGNPSTADIVASATMAFQFCEGTNSEARTLKIGIAGAGIRLMGTTTAPATPANGDIRVNSTGTMLNRSNGFLYTMGTPYVSKSANYTLVQYDDYCVEVTSGTNTQTLPTAVGYSGSAFEIKNSGAGTVTVATTSSQTMDGVLTLTLLPGQCVTVRSNNANWIIISRY